jgi:hypothetical protein
MKNKTSIIVVVVNTAVLAGALVFYGVSDRQLGHNNQAAPQNPVVPPAPAAGAAQNLPKPDAGVPVDPSAAVASTSPGTQNPSADASAQLQRDHDTNDDAVPAPQVSVKRIVVAVPTVADTQESALAAPMVTAVATSPDTSLPPPSSSKHTLIVPAGTVLTVRLGEELGSDISEVGQSFSATLDRDVTVNGNVAIAAGAPLTGKVAFVRPVGPITGEPCLQLKVVSVNVNNADIPVVTSIRSFGPKSQGKNRVSRFVKGLVMRYQHAEKELVLEEQSAYSFTLLQPLRIL